MYFMYCTKCIIYIYINNDRIYDLFLMPRDIFFCKGTGQLRTLTWGLLPTPPSRIAEEIHIELQHETTITAWHNNDPGGMWSYTTHSIWQLWQKSETVEILCGGTSEQAVNTVSYNSNSYTTQSLNAFCLASEIVADVENSM